MSKEPDQKSSRPRIKVSVAELIKFNVNAAIRDRQMKERACVDYLADAVRIYATLHPSKPQPAELLDLEELKNSSDPNKWGQKAIGERIRRESGAMWRTLNPVVDLCGVPYTAVDTRAWVSMSMGLMPSTIAAMAIPLTFSSCWLSRISEGFETSLIPVSFIS